LTGTPVLALTLSGSYLFAGTEYGGVFRLNDEGNSWIEVHNGLTVMNVVTLTAIDEKLFAGTRSGVFLSENLGKSWECVDTGLSNSVILSLQVSDSNLFAGSVGSGVWKRPLLEMTTDIENNQLFYYPNAIALNQNYPNPFNPTTAIGYQLSAISNVELGIYNLLGQKIATLVSERQLAGQYSIEWVASRFPSGVYYYKLQTDGFQDVKKMILLK
jgi:hypothetical protein